MGNSQTSYIVEETITTTFCLVGAREHGNRRHRYRHRRRHRHRQHSGHSGSHSQSQTQAHSVQLVQVPAPEYLISPMVGPPSVLTAPVHLSKHRPLSLDMFPLLQRLMGARPSTPRLLQFPLDWRCSQPNSPLQSRFVWLYCHSGWEGRFSTTAAAAAAARGEERRVSFRIPGSKREGTAGPGGELPPDSGYEHRFRNYQTNFR
jgi:hypothetical protein